MLKFVLCIGLTLGASESLLGQEGFKLAPGERLVAVDGVPVKSNVTSSTTKAQPRCANGSCNVANGNNVAMAPSSGASPRSNAVIGEGTAAYQHALREAQIIAARGGTYHRHSDGGHPLGTAPGCKYSGTGYTWDMNRPGHCWEDELPESRIVARARAQGSNGAWFWSAHYR